MTVDQFRHMKICCPQCGGLPAGCEYCGETGLCCPTCNGGRVLSKGWNGTRVVVVPCPTCQIDMSDGNQYDETRVLQAIDRYIDEWFAGVIEDPVLTHRKLMEVERREREANRTEGRIWKHG